MHLLISKKIIQKPVSVPEFPDLIPVVAAQGHNLRQSAEASAKFVACNCFCANNVEFGCPFQPICDGKELI
jgi:hypothetical protein